MKRLLTALRWEVVLQLRNGFYYASIFFVLFWSGLLSQAPNLHLLEQSKVIPGLVVVNLLITNFYFVAALVLLEKGEGVLSGLVVTPLRTSEYLASKVLSLTGLAILETLLVVTPVFGWTGHPWPLLLGMGLLGSFYTLFGLVAVSRYDSINAYLLPSMGAVIFLLLPLIDLAGLWRSPLFLLHPVQPMLVLMQTAFAPATLGQLLYGYGGALLWLAASFWWARRQIWKMY
jgi:fluoroquinolone transport system permease protein